MTLPPPPPDASAPPEPAPLETGVQSGWVNPPAASPHARRRWFPGCLIVGVLVLIGGPLAATAILDRSAPAGDVQTLGFGTGGSGCTLDGIITSSVAEGTPIHLVGTFAPPLASGSKVIVTVVLDGSPQPDLGGTIDIDSPSDCVNGTITPHLPGHYLVRLETNPSSMPALEGAFDVNP